MRNTLERQSRKVGGAAIPMQWGVDVSPGIAAQMQ